MTQRGTTATRRLTRIYWIALILAMVLPPGVGAAQEPPHPDPGFAADAVPSGECTITNEYEAAYLEAPLGEARYPGVCKRLTFAFGPIVVKPGENDALLQPLVVDKPAYDGYMVRFRTNLLKASDGTPPPTEAMHLHHATWLGISGDDNYGQGPILAAGEEKTIISQPKGYGQRVSGDDVWLLLYMVHNEEATSEVVWLTYEVDFIAEENAQDVAYTEGADAETTSVLPTKQIWLDVQGQIHPEAPSTGSNPVFNVQRGFGDIDPETGRRVCTWPKQNCARHDVYGSVTPQQGQTEDSEGNPIVIPGMDHEVTADVAGTLVHVGGHLHPGGIRDEISLVRDGVEKPMFLSDAIYWDWDEFGVAGGPPHSWNFSMTTAPVDHRVRIKEGDLIRINAVVDSDDASWYEGMGIAMAWVATEGTHGEPSVDLFDDDVIFDRGVGTSDVMPEGVYDPKTNWRPERCEMDLTGENGPKRLCLRGGPSHPGLEESRNFDGGCRQPGDCRDIEAPDGELTTDIVSVAFTYGNADLGVVGQTGIPLLKKGEPVKLWNYDTVARIWHTYTRCAYPCNGPTDLAFPIADGGKGDPEDVMDFDSNEIGYGLAWEPASGQFPSSGTGKGTERTLRDGLYTEFTPTETGTYTFFCRIHHGMRGVFKVVD